MDLPLVTIRKQNTLNSRSILFLKLTVVVSMVGILKGTKWRVLEIWEKLGNGTEAQPTAMTCSPLSPSFPVVLLPSLMLSLCLSRAMYSMIQNCPGQRLFLLTSVFHSYTVKFLGWPVHLSDIPILGEHFGANNVPGTIPGALPALIHLLLPTTL